MALCVTAHSVLFCSYRRLCADISFFYISGRIKFRLPFVDNHTEDATMANPKILLVEDDQDVLQSMHVRLKANNYDVAFASDAIACMSEARRFEPDVIILDLGLPAGDGFMLMQRFKQIPSLAHVPVIVVTGQDLRNCRHRMMQAGARSVMQKPVDNTLLLATIQKALGATKSADGPPVYDLKPS
jgi:DNA-binding response OmpR family regulator